MVSEVNLKLTQEVKEIQEKVSEYILEIFEDKDYDATAMIIGVSIALGKVKEAYLSHVGEEFREVTNRTSNNAQEIARRGGGMLTEDGILLPFGGSLDPEEVN